VHSRQRSQIIVFKHPYRAVGSQVVPGGVLLLIFVDTLRFHGSVAVKGGNIAAVGAGIVIHGGSECSFLIVTLHQSDGFSIAEYGLVPQRAVGIIPFPWPGAETVVVEGILPGNPDRGKQTCQENEI
jgi:hypothetical protein